MLSLKKTNEPIPRKLTDRRKDKRTDPILQDPSDQGRRSNKHIIIFIHTYHPNKYQLFLSYSNSSFSLAKTSPNLK